MRSGRFQGENAFYPVGLRVRSGRFEGEKFEAGRFEGENASLIVGIAHLRYLSRIPSYPKYGENSL